MLPLFTSAGALITVPASLSQAPYTYTAGLKYDKAGRLVVSG